MKHVVCIALLGMFTWACDKSEDSNKSSADVAATSNDHNHGDHYHGDHNHGDQEMGEAGNLVNSKNSLAAAKLSFETESDTISAGTSYMASVKFFDAEGNMIEGVTVTDITPWMVTMGHGTNEEGLDFHKHAEAGHHWMITGLQFSMPGNEGEWVIKVSIDFGEGQDEVHIPVAQVN